MAGHPNSALGVAGATPMAPGSGSATWQIHPLGPLGVAPANLWVWPRGWIALGVVSATPKAELGWLAILYFFNILFYFYFLKK